MQPATRYLPSPTCTRPYYREKPYIDGQTDRQTDQQTDQHTDGPIAINKTEDPSPSPTHMDCNECTHIMHDC